MTKMDDIYFLYIFKFFLGVFFRVGSGIIYHLFGILEYKSNLFSKN